MRGIREVTCFGKLLIIHLRGEMRAGFRVSRAVRTAYYVLAINGVKVRILVNPTEINGAFVLVSDLSKDERGTFSRTFCSQEFEQLGLVNKLD